MKEIFSDCSALTTILSFAFRNCFASDAMFYECTSLQGTTNFKEKHRRPNGYPPKGDTLVDIRGLGSFLAH